MAAPMFSIMSASPSIDLKANGEVSRMRSHKGNMPSLPQTKYCHLCPAKFTRTTHLNRHLRSHTNERLHRCNVCNAEFTRSDLLTRHKRTCGDSTNANRSRRKSCQACAESKVKCNLQYPCSKCTSRGRECIFINDPEASRNKKNAAKKAASQPQPQNFAADARDLSVPLSTGLFPDSSPAFAGYPPSLLPFDLSSSLLSPRSLFSTVSPPSYDIPTLSTSSGSSPASSSQSSPRSDFFETQPEIEMSGPYSMGFDGTVIDSHLNPLFENHGFDPFLEPSPKSYPLMDPTDFLWTEGNEFYPTHIDEGFNFSHGYDDAGLSEFSSLSSDSSASPSPRSTRSLSAIDPIIGSICDAPPILPTGIIGPAAAELDHYLYLFFTAFSTQIPLIHPATWTMEGKPPMLLSAMQACGALFVKTKMATDFITETLASTRDALIEEFSKLTVNPREQYHLILTMVLLQTIGLFHQKAEHRVSSTVYHGMLVMWIRQNGIVDQIGSWTPLNHDNPEFLVTAWGEWADHETFKRALFLTYLHDCCQSIYFSQPPSFQPSELNICLPCDDALWSAGNPRDWYNLTHLTSPYGVGVPRITGYSMKQALNALDEMRLPAILPPLNPFAHLILIHTILRNIHVSQSGTVPENHMGLTSPQHVLSEANKSASDTAFAIQYALHNWLQMWLNSPESMNLEQSKEEAPFIVNAMPFYWLAQVSLMAIQAGTAVFKTGPSPTDSAGRFRLMKGWLDHIKVFLRRGEQIPTRWDDLMKLRTQLLKDNVQIGDEHVNGLLSFFPRD